MRREAAQRMNVEKTVIVGEPVFQIWNSLKTVIFKTAQLDKR
jgi:hypothetical protein